MNVQIEKSWIDKMHATLNKYAEIPESEWDKVREKIHILKVKKNDYFINCGDKPDKLAFIITGLFRIFYITDLGSERTLVFRGENKFLAAYSSFLQNIDSIFSIQALEDSTLVYIPLENLMNLISEDICWLIIKTKYADELFIEKEKRENEFLCDNAETRYKNFILKYPDYGNRIKQYYIASYLGITPVALSRIRKKYSKN